MGGGKVFISYRRGRDSDSAGRLHDRLERVFGRERLFFDIDSIPPGVDFHHYIDQQVARCAACLVVIGEGWLEQIDRLHGEDNFVRIEIAAALRREGVRVISILVQGATMPKRDMLPDPVQPLSRRNAVEVPYAHFAAVVDGRIVFAIRLAFAEAGLPPANADAAETAPPMILSLQLFRPEIAADAVAAEIAHLEGHAEARLSVAFSPDGKRLATGSHDRTARIWDLATGAQVIRLEGHSGDVTSVAFFPNGALLATESLDCTARLWNLATGGEIDRLLGHMGFVHCVAFSPDGTRLATASADKTARIWSVGER